MPVEQNEAYTCTPKSLLDSNPCLACLSEKELLAVLVAILMVQANKTVAQVLSDSACFTCMSDKEMLQAIVTIMGNELLGDSETSQTVIDQGHCLVCATPKQLKAAFLQLICNLGLVAQ